MTKRKQRQKNNWQSEYDTKMSCLIVTNIIFRANENLTGKQKSADREIARLNAQIRKAEMNVASMEEKIKLKVNILRT